MSRQHSSHRRKRQELVAPCRRLRSDSTYPERLLWSRLRDRRLCGLKFRRQYSVGPYVVDFVCLESRLAVEVDGMSHVGRGEADDARSVFLERQGLRVIRVTNDEVLGDLDMVLEYIAREAGVKI